MTDWNRYAEIAQVVLVPVTAVGVLVSLAIGVRTLKELRDERLQRSKPILLFDGGGHQMPAKLSDSYRIPGIDPRFAMSITENRPRGPNRLDIDGMFNNLRNHGQGPALAVRITYIPYRVFIGEEPFVIDRAKRNEPVYSSRLNTINSFPNHIAPGERGAFGRLPTALVVDFERKISRMDCVIRIECDDVFRNRHKCFQGVRIYVDVGAEAKEGSVTLTFLEELNPSSPDFSIFGNPDTLPVSFA